LYTAQTVFSVEVGTNYGVLGLGLFETVLLALICDETGKPNWLPIGLFEFEHQRLPDDWEFAVLDGVAASGSDSSNSSETPSVSTSLSSVIRLRSKSFSERWRSYEARLAVHRKGLL
jgi:hypothetical protein